MITEAMAASLPVVVSRLAGAAELITHGEDGLLLDDPENVDELVRNLQTLLTPERRRGLGEKGLAVARRYNCENLCKAHEAVYAEVLAEKTSAP